jgi:hypothetical protein
MCSGFNLGEKEQCVVDVTGVGRETATLYAADMS